MSHYIPPGSGPVWGTLSPPKFVHGGGGGGRGQSSPSIMVSLVNTLI